MHERLRVDVLVVLHEIEAALEPLVDHAAVVAPGQSELRLGGGAQQRPAELVEPLALDDQAGGWPLEGLHVGHRNADVLQARRLERLEAEDIADQARGHVRDRALFEQDDVVSHPGEVLAGNARHRLDLVGLGAIAVAGGESIGPHHGPGRGARLSGDRRGGLDRVDAVLRGDAKQADGVGVLRDVVGVPITHLAIFEHAGGITRPGVLDRRLT